MCLFAVRLQLRYDFGLFFLCFVLGIALFDFEWTSLISLFDVRHITTLKIIL